MMTKMSVFSNKLFKRQEERNTMSIKKFYLTNLSKMYTYWEKKFTHYHKADTKDSKKYQVTGISLKFKSKIFKENWFEMILKWSVN